MGIRLYPNTKNTTSLEKLARVPEGTAARLEALEGPYREKCREIQQRYDLLTQEQAAERHALFAEQTQNDEAFYDALYEKGNEDINDYHCFLLFGWGKFRGGDGSCSGRINDLDRARYLLHLNGINFMPGIAELAEGVHWC